MILNLAVSDSSRSALFSFTHGIDTDARLWREEIDVQLAWIQALAALGTISTEESNQVKVALLEAAEKLASDLFPWSIEDEDIHMNLERFVSERCGELGSRIHLGRSRNDLIATTLRLFCSRQAMDTATLIKKLITTLVQQSRDWLDIIAPGLTHMQAGQPVRLGHIMAAHGFALRRDAERLLHVSASSLEECPLGAAAFAGTHLSIDLPGLATSLGFDGPLRNSYDAVGDRDAILDLLNALATLGVHLSRLCQEVVYASSTAVDLLQLPRDFSTGSSIMPNKRNPDVFELVRAKMARVIAAASEGSMIVREVHPSYGTDLHELKRTLLRSLDETRSSIEILIPTVAGLRANPESSQRLLLKGHILGTEIANALVEKRNIPFRDAYRLTAEWITQAESEGKQIHEVAAAHLDMKISFEDAVEARNGAGGTARSQTLHSLEWLGRWATANAAKPDPVVKD